jgi:hypothetical protein
MDGKVINENEQKKNRKEEKDSSDELIDSFFGSSNCRGNLKNHSANKNIQDTEQAIDEILAEKTERVVPKDNLHPTVTIGTKSKNDVVNEECLPFEDDGLENNTSDYEIKSNEKEEIFEIDKPGKQIKENNATQSTKNDVSSNGKETQTGSQKQRENKKIRFSFNLPKLNVKIGKKAKNSKNQGKTSFNHTNIEFEKQVFPKKSGRLHGLSQINEITTEDRGANKSIKKEKQKKSFFKTTKKKPTKQMFFQKEKQHEAEKSSLDQSNEPSVDEDLINLLKITDYLLGKLPDEVIEEFSQSEDFSLYEKVMRKYDIVK